MFNILSHQANKCKLKLHLDSISPQAELLSSRKQTNVGPTEEPEAGGEQVLGLAGWQALRKGRREKRCSSR